MTREPITQGPLSGPVVPQPRRLPSLLSRAYLRWLLLSLVVAAILVTILLRNRLTDVDYLVETLGYPGIALAAFLGAAGMVLPVPSAAATFLGGALLDPLYVGLLAGICEGIGEFSGYAIGYSGSDIAARSRFYPRFESWVRRWGWGPIFLLSVVPNLLFDVVGIAAGALRLSPWKFFLAAWSGKTIKNLGLAYAGSLGADWVRNLLGMQ